MTTPPVPASRVAPTVVAVLLALGAMAAVLAGVRSGLFDLDRHAVPKELALHLTALLVLPMLAWSLHRIRLTVPEYLVVAWVLWSALSALFAANHWQAVRALGITASSAIIFWAARRTAAGQRQGIVLWGMALAGLVATATALAQAYGAEHWIFAESRAPGGSLGNRNFAAHLAVMTLPVLLLLALRARRAVPLLVALGGVIATVGLVTLTRSRAAWLAALVSLGLLALCAIVASRRGGWSLPPGRARSMLLAMALGIAGAMTIPNVLEWRSESPYRDTLSALVDAEGGSGRGRLIQYRNTLALVRQSPVFGTGPGNWAVEYPRVTTPGDPSFAGWAPIPTNPWPSSDWVAMLSERGPAGVLLLLLAGLAMAVMALRRVRHEDPAEAHRAATLLAVLAATATCGAFDAVLLQPLPSLVFFAVAGVLLPDAGPVFLRPLSRRGTILMLPLLVGVSTIFAGRSAAQLAAMLVAGRGQDVGQVYQAGRIDPGNLRYQLILAARLPCRQARQHAAQALRLYPHHPSVKRVVARCGGGTIT